MHLGVRFPFDPLLQTNLGDGIIDNFIVDSSVHLAMGVAVLLSMTAATILVGIDAFKKRPVSKAAKVAVAAAQLCLTLQLLLGIKLLDQGQGVGQLYIHYVGGLLPLGAFLLGGWIANTERPRGSTILCALVTVGYFSALMAFFIGRAYVNS